MEGRAWSAAPIVVLGAHRSGTSLVTRLLGELGLFVGARVDENEEALAFSRLNTWILSCCGGRWDTPRCIDYLVENEEAMELTADYLFHRLNMVSGREYLGIGYWLRYGSPANLPEVWGWKDPRNTITLPIWLKLFPKARLVHVVRNGVDVAESLYRREKNGFREAKARYERFRIAAVARGKAGWFGESPRVMNRGAGFALWREYVEYAERFLEPVRAQTFELRYEDFLADAELMLGRLTDFCGLRPERSRIGEVCKAVRVGRRFGFAQDTELYEFWSSVRELPEMARYGYGELDLKS